MGNIDLKVVELACMADLGRLRQEELPLNDVSRRGPSFAPIGRNGIAHISSGARATLQSQWSGGVRDEESEQMDGLALEDARPWATSAVNKYMDAHRVMTAPPGLNRNAQRSTAGQGRRAQLPVPVGRLGGLIPPSSNGNRGPSSSHRVGNENTPLGSTPRTVADIPTPRSAVQQSRSVVAPQPAILPKESKDTYDHVLLDGNCEVLPNAQETGKFAAAFSMKISTAANSAVLTLSATEKEERVHNVLDLECPVLQDQFCFVASRQGRGTAKYHLRFQQISETEKFRIYLDNLQLAAARHESSSSTEVVSGTLNQSTGGQDAGSSSAPRKSASVVGAPDSIAVALQDGARVASSVESHTNISADKKLPNLIDIDEPSAENVAQRLHDLVSKMLPSIVGPGKLVSEKTRRAIEEATIENWLGRGFLSDETDDMKEDLTTLVRLLMQIKAKAEMRQKSSEPRSASQQLSSLNETPKKKSPVIKYTSLEIKSLQHKRKSPPQDIERPNERRQKGAGSKELSPEDILKLRTPASSSLEASRNDTSMKDGLGQVSARVQVPSPSPSAALAPTAKPTPPKISHGGGVDQDAAVSGGSNTITTSVPSVIPHPQNLPPPQKQPASSPTVPFRGLATSQWANANLQLAPSARPTPAASPVPSQSGYAAGPPPSELNNADIGSRSPASPAMSASSKVSRKEGFRGLATSRWAKK